MYQKPLAATELLAAEDIKTRGLFEEILRTQTAAGHQRAIVLVMVPITGAPMTDLQCQSNLTASRDVLGALKVFISELEKQLPPLN